MVPLEETENACVSFAEEAVSPFSSYNLGATLMTFAIIMLSVGYGIYASCRAVRLATSDTTRRHRNRLTAVAGYATVSVVLLGGALFIGWTFCNQPEKILPNPYGMVMHYDEQSLKAKTLRKNNVRSIDSHYQITELDGWDGRLYNAFPQTYRITFRKGDVWQSAKLVLDDNSGTLYVTGTDGTAYEYGTAKADEALRQTANGLVYLGGYED